MALYIQIPKDLSKVKDKFIAGLTKRQTIFFSIGLGLGGLTYYLTFKQLGTSISGTLLFIIASPFIFTALYEKNGFTLEQIAINYIRQRYLLPQIRTYKSENIYSSIEKQIEINKEVEMLETGKKCIKKEIN